MRLLGLLSGGAEIAGGGAGGEVAGEDGLEEGVEDNLGAGSLGKGHPEDEDELEGIVEGEPVHGVDGTLEDGQESVDDPVGQPLAIIRRLGGEQRLQGVVRGNGKANGVCQEVGTDVEEDHEEVEDTEAKDNIDLGDIGLLLKVVEGWVFGELLIELGDLVLSAVLDRHVEVLESCLEGVLQKTGLL